jgi:hypothetical protein
MPRLPDVTDFGARPSLRTDRIDPVYPEGVEVAEAISNAALAFAEAYGQQQQKDSRIKYALAKNEIMAMDLQVRQGLAERQDFENFDEAYTQDFVSGANEILGRHGNRFTKEDAALFQSEINLMRERGRATVAEFAKGLEVDLGRADTVTALEQFTEFAHMTSGEERNDYIEQGLETVKAAEEEGWYTEEEADALTHTFATTLATDSLGNMDAEDRLAEVQLAILWREKHGKPLSKEDAAAGLGSGSIGDFLSLSALRKIEKATEDEIDIEGYMAAGQDASDSAWDLYDGIDQVRQREAHVREMTKGDPRARTEGMLRVRQRQNSEEGAERLEQNSQYQDLYNGQIESDGAAQLDPGVLSKLPPSLQEDLRGIQKQELEGAGWAASTSWEAREAWEGLTDGQKARTIFHTDPPEYQEKLLQEMGFTEEEIAAAGLWTDNYGNQHAWRATTAADRASYMLADRAQALARVRAGGSKDHTGSLSQEQLLERALVTSPYFEVKPTVASEPEVREAWMRISDEYNSQLVELHDQGVTIDDTKRKEVLANIMIKEVSIRRKLGDDDVLYAGMLPEDYAEGYIEHDREIRIVPGEAPTTLDTALMQIPERYGGVAGEKQYVRDWIKKRIASSNNEPVDEIDIDEIEEVWFYLLTQGWDAAEARIKRSYGM